MRIATASKKEVWRGRGRPRRVVPPEIQAFADSTYRTGLVKVVHVDEGEDGELKELIGLLNSYAGSLGRRMRVQREGNEVRFEMIDIKKRKVQP